MSLNTSSPAFRAPPLPATGEVRRARSARPRNDLRKESDERLAQWITPFRKTAITLRTETVVGTAFVEIVRAVLKQKADLLIAGTRGQGALHRLLVGSTAERLMRKCPCPVWIVHPEHEWPLRRILVAVDLTEVSGKCLKLAAAFAQMWKCDLEALYVFNEPASRSDSRKCRRAWRWPGPAAPRVSQSGGRALAPVRGRATSPPASRSRNGWRWVMPGG